MGEEEANAIVGAGIKEVEIRSLFTCQTKDGVCQHCREPKHDVIALGAVVGSPGILDLPFGGFSVQEVHSGDDHGVVHGAMAIVKHIGFVEM